MTLDNTKIKKYNDLIDALLKQYKLNTDIAPEWISLIVMEKNNKKIVREYTHK
jgi:hypothetical protein